MFQIKDASQAGYQYQPNVTRLSRELGQFRVEWSAKEGSAFIICVSDALEPPPDNRQMLRGLTEAQAAALTAGQTLDLTETYHAVLEYVRRDVWGGGGKGAALNIRGMLSVPVRAQVWAVDHESGTVYLPQPLERTKCVRSEVRYCVRQKGFWNKRTIVTIEQVEGQRPAMEGCLVYKISGILDEYPIPYKMWQQGFELVARPESVTVAAAGESANLFYVHT